MLRLKLPADGSGGDSRHSIVLSERAAARLERALLCQGASRKREIVEALADDEPLSGWALRTAELRRGRTVNRLEEAAEWLSGCLAHELSNSLIIDPASAADDGIRWRLPILARNLADLERQLAAFHARLEHEKLESLKELAYGASHEINNPLANIAARAQTLIREESDPDRRRKLSAIHRQAMRAHEMIADLMLFARPPKLTLAPCNLGALVARVVDQARELATEANVDLVYELPDAPVFSPADDTQLGVAVRALLVNSIEALGQGGQVQILVEQTTVDGLARARIAVCDDGPGISDDVRRHMFDPFYSGREAGRGLGFGLSKCWRIVTDHGGNVIAQQPARGGAEIEILLPFEPTPDRANGGHPRDSRERQHC